MYSAAANLPLIKSIEIYTFFFLPLSAESKMFKLASQEARKQTILEPQFGFVRICLHVTFFKL